MREKLLLLDFDGTLCLGDDPVLVYAEQVDTMLEQQGLGKTLTGSDTGTGAVPTVRQIVAPALASSTVSAEEPPQDGYQLVRRLADRAGLSEADAGRAFRAARQQILARGLASTDVHAPAGVRELLAEMRRGAVVVLVTNSPADAFRPWLEHLELTDAFDAVINDAGKPSGMATALRRARAAGGRPVAAEQVLSVGDIWANDLEHVHALGGGTILIDRFATGLGRPTHRVQDFDQAVDPIRAWGAEIL